MISQLCWGAHPRHVMPQCCACLDSTVAKGDQRQAMLPADLPEACQDARPLGIALLVLTLGLSHHL